MQFSPNMTVIFFPISFSDVIIIIIVIIIIAKNRSIFPRIKQIFGWINEKFCYDLHFIHALCGFRPCTLGSPVIISISQ